MAVVAESAVQSVVACGVAMLEVPATVRQGLPLVGRVGGLAASLESGATVAAAPVASVAAPVERVDAADIER